MKTWMKILMWLGLGGGIGFFAGYQVGYEKSNKRIEMMQVSEWSAYEGGYNQALRDNHIIDQKETWEDVHEALEEYRGRHNESEEEPQMPEDPPVIGDEAEIEDVPELHQQHLIPEQISEEEYYENKWGYDQEELVYYEDDKVLYDTATRKALKTQDDIDQVIGIGMLYCFRLKDGEALDAIFVRNDTMGVIFRIDRVEAAYEDEVSGADAPDYEEDDDFTEEDPD